MTWGQAWGEAWGAAFGDTAKFIISGSGSADQPASEVSGTGYIPGGAADAVAPDAYPGGGGVPSTYLLQESAQRNGFILTGTGQAQQLPGEARGTAQVGLVPLVGTATAIQPCSEVSGAARIKLVSLVAESASVAHEAGEVVAIAEFRDIEFEIVAMLLAA